MNYLNLALSPVADVIRNYINEIITLAADISSFLENVFKINSNLSFKSCWILSHSSNTTHLSYENYVVGEFI